MDFESLVLLILMSTHLLAFGMGWGLRDVARRERRRSIG